MTLRIRVGIPQCGQHSAVLIGTRVEKSNITLSQKFLMNRTRVEMALRIQVGIPQCDQQC